MFAMPPSSPAPAVVSGFASVFGDFFFFVRSPTCSGTLRAGSLSFSGGAGVCAGPDFASRATRRRLGSARTARARFTLPRQARRSSIASFLVMLVEFSCDC
jgi:hypothetical protein